MGRPRRNPPRPDGYVVPLPRSDPYDPNGRLWPLLKVFLRGYRLVCAGRVRVVGRENIPRQPTIIVSNHAFVSDAFILALIFGRIQSLAQVEAFTLPFFGWLLGRAGQIPVIRGQRDQVLARAADQLGRGRHVLIYPEGELSHGGDLHSGRTGAAELSSTTSAPVLPVGFYVPQKYGRAFHSRHYNRRTYGVWQVGGPCFVAIDEPWQPFAGGPAPDLDRLRSTTDQIMIRIETALERARGLAA